MTLVQQVEKLIQMKILIYLNSGFRKTDFSRKPLTSENIWIVRSLKLWKEKKNMFKTVNYNIEWSCGF